MCSTCKYPDRMSIMVQIRNVPSDLHRELKARAALEGMSLLDYLLRELRHALERPTLDEMRKRLSRRHPVQLRTAAETYFTVQLAAPFPLVNRPSAPEQRRNAPYRKDVEGNQTRVLRAMR
jgi:antitoxin FitA